MSNWDISDELLNSILRAQRPSEWKAPSKLLSEFRSHCQVAKAAWPRIRVGANDFVAKLADHLSENDTLGPVKSADLYLATACSMGDEDAIATCEKEFITPLSSALLRFENAIPLREALQIVRHHIFVKAGNDCPPKISEYKGNGALGGWIRVVATRRIISEIRSKAKHTHIETEIESFEDGDDSPDIALLKEKYRDSFQTAFTKALDELSSREKTLLRLQYIDGLGIDKLALVYSVHRATAARWVAAARKKVRSETQKKLMEHIAASETEVQSVIRLVQSQLDLSLKKFLETTNEA